MKILRGCLLLFLVNIGFNSFAQDKTTEKADRHYVDMAYPTALDAYLKVVKEYPKNKHATVRLAECYRLTNDTRNAQRWYARAVKFKGIKPQTWFEYGQILMLNRKYDAAIPWFEKYQQAVPGDERAAEMIDACQNSQSFSLEARLYALRKLKVNTEYSDFGPVFFGNKVVFASSRKRQISKYSRNGQGFLDLYIADYSGKTDLGEAELFRGKVNTPYHEATACFSADGEEMFFTRNNYVKGRLEESSNGVVNLATYTSVYVDGKWQEAELLPFNNDEYSIGHPCLSPDGNSLYFVSNMPGGAGGTDLYVAERTENGWGVPVSMGDKLNTKGNEMFPWMDEAGSLYFASDGFAGLGGLDIYKVERMGEEFGPVENMGAPINSPRDDFGLIYRAEDGIGYFTSNRPGGKGDDDLWAFKKLIPLVGFVRDQEGNPVLDATITVMTGRSAVRLPVDPEGKFIYGLADRQTCKLVFAKEGFLRQEMEVKSGDLDREQENVRVVVMEKGAE